MGAIVVRLATQHIAAARAICRPRTECRALLCTEVLQIPTLAGGARAVGRVGMYAVLVVRCLAVGEDTLLVDREPQAVRECCHCLRQSLDLCGGWRLAPEVVRRRTDAAEEGDADAPAVAQVGRGEHIVEYTIPDDVDAAVRIDLHMVVREELPVVPRRPVQVEPSLLLVTWDICQYKNKPQICSPGLIHKHQILNFSHIQPHLLVQLISTHIQHPCRFTIYESGILV